MFIVLEGIDGSGKTTLSEKLVTSLQSKGLNCVRFSEPTKYESGIYIRRFLSGEIILTKEEQIDAFIEDRIISVEKNILPVINAGSTVILDRYYYSTAAYQASFNYSPEKILNMNLEKNFPKPDLLFFLEISPETALERLKKRGNKLEVFESLQSLKSIHSNFQEILPVSTVRLDATLSSDTLEEICLSHILR